MFRRRYLKRILSQSVVGLYAYLVQDKEKITRLYLVKILLVEQMIWIFKFLVIMRFRAVIML